jgi:hypothetical protein
MIIIFFIKILIPRLKFDLICQTVLEWFVQIRIYILKSGLATHEHSKHFIFHFYIILTPLVFLNIWLRHFCHAWERHAIALPKLVLATVCTFYLLKIFFTLGSWIGPSYLHRNYTRYVYIMD